MRPVYTAAQMGAIDAAAGVPVAVLIERAGAAVARTALAMLGGGYGRRVVVIAGTGNNGADGRVAARRLAERGVLVTVVPADGAPALITDGDLVIDAAYGTGFRGSWSPPVVGRIPVLAVDIPSGVHADTGMVGGRVLRATRTVTFHALKPGLVIGPGAELAGEIEVADIGLPWAHTDVVLGDDAEVAGVWPQRAPGAHKWDQALRIVAGSDTMTGAAVLCAGAAQRAGAGMVQLSSPAGVVAGAPVEVVQRPLPAGQWADAALADLGRVHALAVGPGLGRSADTVRSVLDLVPAAACPLVLDGDGLFAVSTLGVAGLALLRARHAPTVLTPHDGEFGLLMGARPGDDRIAAARELAGRAGSVVLLKGPTTVVAPPDGHVTLVTHGDQRLATAGSGDVLTGIIAALLAAGCRPERAAFLGAWAHASTLDHLPPVGVVASDLIAALPLALASMGAKPSDSRSFRAHAAPPRPLPASMGAHTSDSRSFRAHAGGGQAWVRARGRP